MDLLPIRHKTTVAWKSLLTVLFEFSFPAPKATCSDTQVALDLGCTLAACFWQSDCFDLEFVGICLSCLCHSVPPQVILYTILAYLRAHFFGGTPIIYLGVIAKQDDWVKIIHRPDRCDLSLFQLGLSLLDHFIDEHISIPVAFQMPLAKSVR